MKDDKATRAAVATLLGKQHSVVTREQAEAAGLTQAAIDYRIRPDGPWQRVLPGVYLAVTGVATPRQREVAALLYAGPASVLTGLSALRRHRFRASAGDVIDVLVPSERQRGSRSFASLHRTTKMPELYCAEGAVRWVLPARAVADAARGMTILADVRAVVAESVQRGHCSLAMLRAELESGPVQGSALLRRTLAEVADGIRSAAEADLRDLIKRARLPVPMFNPRLYAGDTLIAVPDCWWPEAGLAAEVDSREWHLSPRDWEHTMRRHASMSSYGIITLHFTPRQIRQEAAVVAAAIRDALRAGRKRPQLPIRAVSAA